MKSTNPSLVVAVFALPQMLASCNFEQDAADGGKPPAAKRRSASHGASFVNWETAHGKPVDITPDASKLLVVNLPDARLEVYELATGLPVHSTSIPVGIDPVSVTARTDNEAWVVNHLSDSVSVVDLAAGNVVATLDTDNEPYDVVFAGSPQRAFVSCSQANTVLVFNPNDRAAAPQRIAIEGEDPRTMAVSPDGQTVYVAIFESGNRTTILADGSTINAFPGNVVSTTGPYPGATPRQFRNPPPNNGANFTPPFHSGANPPPVPLIVQQRKDGRWFDDNGCVTGGSLATCGTEWTRWVSGADAGDSGRPPGWTLIDNDVARIRAHTLAVDYATGLMNICRGIAVNPRNGSVAVVGTDALNRIRYEPNLRGNFARMNMAVVNPDTLASNVSNLNSHLEERAGPRDPLPLAERAKALGTPAGARWNRAGTEVYVTGFGSNNVIVMDASGNRIGSPIAVGEGPTGIALDDSRGRAYVLNKHSSSISVIDLGVRAETARISLPYDPTPAEVITGRPHLYGSTNKSARGEASCASCHEGASMDQLAWGSR